MTSVGPIGAQVKCRDILQVEARFHKWNEGTMSLHLYAPGRSAPDLDL
jgi:hypothetical protein